MVFFDASAVVKAYVPEPGSPSVQGAVARLKGKLYLTRAIALEVLGTLARKHRRTELTLAEYRAARTRFLAELETKFRVLDLPEADYQAAFGLVDAHRRIGAGPLDVLHLVSALRLQAQSTGIPVTLASSDTAFLSLAQAAGLATFDPETQPLGVLLARVR